MFARFTGRSRKSLPTHHPPSLERSTLGSRNPSHVSIQQVLWTEEDMVGLAGWDGDLSNSRIGQRFYERVPLRRTDSQSVAPSKKKHTTYFTRQSRIPHWMNPAWVQPVCHALKRARHPDWWEAHQEHVRRREDRSDRMTNDHDDSYGAFTHVPPPSSYANTAIYPTINETNMQQDARKRELASKQSEPSVNPNKVSRPLPENGRLRKDERMCQRDIITTIGSFISRATTRVMDRIKGRTCDFEAKPIRVKSRKGPRFPIDGCENETKPSSTVHSLNEIPSPITLSTEQDTGLRNYTPARVPARFTNRLTKIPPRATASPPLSVHRSDLPDTLDKDTGRRLSHHSRHSHLSSLRRKTPSPDTTPLSRPYVPHSNRTSVPLVPKIDMDFSVGSGDWGPLSERGSPPSEAGGSCMTGPTLVGESREGSVSSACNDRIHSPHHSAATITGLQRGGSEASMGSWTTAASIDDRRANENTLEKSTETTGPQFTLAPHTDLPPERPFMDLTSSFWKPHGLGATGQYQQPSFDRTTSAEHRQSSQPSNSGHFAWQTYRSEGMA